MKNFLTSALLAPIMLSLVLFVPVPMAQAQQNNLKIGDGGTNIRLIKMGRVTLSAGVGVVTDSAATATANIWVMRQTIGGTAGQSYDITRTAGTSFTITARAADGAAAATGDTSTIAWLILQP